MVGQLEIDRAHFLRVCGECTKKTGLSVGPLFWECLKDESPEFQAAAMKSYGGRYGDNMEDSHSMKDLLRMHTCTTDDDGTPPLRNFNFTYVVPPCPRDEVSATAGGYNYKPGYLPKGNDLRAVPPGGSSGSSGSGGVMTVSEAKIWCAQQPECRGFTFESPLEQSPHLKAQMYFKNKGGATGAGAGWHSYVQKRAATCVADPQPQTFVVDVLKESPFTAIVRGFASVDECDHMRKLCEPQLQRSTVGGGANGTTTDDGRTSRSANMFPDLDDDSALLTVFTRRLFATARQFTGLDLQPDGQEPINAVVYAPGQQYKPHCDGDCSDRPYVRGKRTATTLLYCTVADSGGGTSFTKGGIKVAPRARDLLFFDHRQRTDPPGTGNMARDTEHSGCPVKAGTKWVATQWFRDGVSTSEPWNTFENWGRSGL